MDSTSNVTGTTYITATGGTETTCGDYKIHTFTSDATFCVSALSTNPSYNNVDYVVVAGGGGSGNGGGGAGGYRESYCATTSGCYTASPLASPTFTSFSNSLSNNSWCRWCRSFRSNTRSRFNFFKYNKYRWRSWRKHTFLNSNCLWCFWRFWGWSITWCIYTSSY
jgi:hypothetical protein